MKHLKFCPSLKSLTILFFFLAFSLPSFAEVEIKGLPSQLKGFLQPKTNSVILVGEAMEIIKSNQARMTLKLVSNSNQLSEAIKQNRTLRESIINTLNKAGIENRNISISQFSSPDDHTWVGNQNRFQAMNRITITVLNEYQMETIAKIIDNSDQISILSIEFINFAQNEFENEVRARAIEKVLQQKSFYEKKLGLNLTPIHFKHTPAYLSINSNQNQQQTQPNKVFDEKIYKSVVEVEFVVH